MNLGKRKRTKKREKAKRKEITKEQKKLITQYLIKNMVVKNGVKIKIQK